MEKKMGKFIVKYQCSICGKFFKTWEEWNEHMWEEHGIR